MKKIIFIAFLLIGCTSSISSPAKITIYVLQTNHKMIQAQIKSIEDPGAYSLQLRPGMKIDIMTKENQPNTYLHETHKVIIDKKPAFWVTVSASQYYYMTH